MKDIPLEKRSELGQSLIHEPNFSIRAKAIEVFRLFFSSYSLVQLLAHLGNEPSVSFMSVIHYYITNVDAKDLTNHLLSVLPCNKREQGSETKPVDLNADKENVAVDPVSIKTDTPVKSEHPDHPDVRVLNSS